MSSTGVPQGSVLAPFLFIPYTADYEYNSESCHIQKYSDDTVITVCKRKGQEEYRKLVRTFSVWSEKNGPLLNVSKTKEMVLDFRRTKAPFTLSVSEGCTLRYCRPINT